MPELNGSAMCLLVHCLRGSLRIYRKSRSNTARKMMVNFLLISLHLPFFYIASLFSAFTLPDNVLSATFYSGKI
jgi:hypothetical protein